MAPAAAAGRARLQRGGGTGGGARGRAIASLQATPTVQATHAQVCYHVDEYQQTP